MALSRNKPVQRWSQHRIRAWHLYSGKRWQWSCACGFRGDEHQSEGQARSAFEKHRDDADSERGTDSNAHADPGPPAAAPPAPPTAGESDAAIRLRELQRLRDESLITNEEFETRRAPLVEEL